MSETIEKPNEIKAFSEPAAMSEELLLKWMPQLSPIQLQQFTEYYKLLLEWNAKVNLTRITEPEEVAQKHFADSIVASELIPSGARVVDVGTGAGFPGVPLKIVRPDIELVLVDSLGKRIRFLEELTCALGIEAEAVHARAEDAARQANLREGFDIALSRAVAPMNVLMELTTPFVKPGGASLMYKGSGARDELSVCGRALSILNCRADSIDYEVPWGARTVVRAVKTGNTPKKYPRKAGFIEKAPLL
jgi:16S rRNA (guanine527-N7)-methyltransferase